MRVAHSQRLAISLLAAALVSLTLTINYLAAPAPPLVREEAMSAVVSRDAVTITTPIALKSGTFRGTLTLELVDESGRTMGTGSIPINIARGESSPKTRIEWPQFSNEKKWQELRNLVMWTRVRYRLTPASTKDCALTEVTGLRALGPMVADLFSLRVVTHFEPSQDEPTHVRVFAENPFTGGPISGARIDAALYPHGDGDENKRPTRSVKISSVTGADGGVSFDLLLPPVPAEERDAAVDYELKVVGVRGVLRVEDERELDFVRRTDAIITTDKPLYQPGQPLHVRTLVYDPASRRPRASETITIQIQDEVYRTVFERRLTTDRFGVAFAQWIIPATAPLGAYSIEVEDAGGDRIREAEVRVSRYELPTFVANVEPDLPYYLPGQDSKVKVTARFVYGEPVKTGQVRVAREASRQWSFKEQRWDVREEGIWEGATDGEGCYTLTIPLQTEHKALEDETYDKYRDLEYVARYTEAASGRSEERRFRLRVTKQAIHVYTFSPDARQPLVMPLRFYVLANYADGSPAECEVSVAARETDPEDPQAFNVRARTDRHGLALIEKALLKESSDLKLTISARDVNGLSGECEDSMPISGEGLRIRTARSLYHRGEPLRVEIDSTVRNIPRLFVELLSGERIVRTQTLEVRDQHAVVEFRAGRDLAGLVTIVAYAPGGPDEWMLNNDLFAARTVLYPVKRALGLEARFDRSSVKPGEPVQAVFSSMGPDGRPRETSLGVVVYDSAVEERERTESESGQGRNYFGAYYARFYNWYASLSDVTLRDLEELDESQPFPTDLELIGGALLQRVGGGYAYRTDAVRLEGKIVRSPFRDELDPLGKTIEHILDRQPTLQYPRDAAALFATLTRNGVQLEKMADLWGNPYYLKFPIIDDKCTVNISSAGPDEQRGSADDFDLTEHSKPFFDPQWAEQVKKAVDGFNYRQGRLPKTSDEVIAELSANGLSFFSLRDPWNSPYRLVYQPSTYSPFYAVTVLSSGPDRKPYVEGHHDDIMVARFERNWFVETDALISRALSKRYTVTRGYPASEAEFIAVLKDEGIDFAALRDPWDQQFKVVFSESTRYADRAHLERVAATPTSPAIDRVRLEPITQRMRHLRIQSSPPKGVNAVSDPAAFTLATFNQVVSEVSRADAITQREMESLPFNESAPSRRAKLPATGLAGAISGTVVDPAGAIIPGVRLTLTNAATASEQTATSNDAGYFAFVNLPPGTYSLRADATGFKVSIVESIEVRLSITTTLDLTLSVGTVTETVTVSAGEAVIQTESASVVSSLETNQFVEQFWLRRDSPNAASTPRLRQDFPETLVWQPSLITDSQGKAEVKFNVADSITTWRMAVIASTEDGLIGSATADLRAFQAFFAEHQPPPSLTIGDEIETPIVVRNYQDRAADVRVKLVPAPWMQLLAGADQSVSAQPKGSSTALASFQAIAAGEFKQEAFAIGAEDGDRVARSVSVRFDGRDTWQTQADLFQGETTLDVNIPQHTIPGSANVELKVYPDLFAHALEGIEGIVQRPYGCLEQATSAGYANLLVLQYLKRSGRDLPAVERKASLNLAEAVARIRSFANPDGGYGYFSGAEADTALTAYVLRFLTEAREFLMIDPSVVDSTREYLARGQRADGIWEARSPYLREVSREGTARLTALVARALAASEDREERSKVADSSPQKPPPQSKRALVRSLDWLARATREFDDPYALALYLLAARDIGRAGAVHEAAKALEGLATVEAGALFWDQRGGTPFYGWGNAGRFETTGLVVEALNAAAADSTSDRDGFVRVARRGLLFLIQNKDQYGVWCSTQATVNALRAVIGMAPGGEEKPKALKLEIGVPGSESKVLEIPADAGAPVSIDLSTMFPEFNKRSGVHQITLRADTATALSAAIVVRGSVPWVEKDARGISEEGGLRLRVSYDRLESKQGETINCAVHAERVGSAGYGMMLAEIGLPPGVDVDLDSLKRAHLMRFDVTPDRVVLYLWPHAGGTDFSFGFRPRLRIKAAAQPSVLYDYYNPDARVSVPPARFIVR